MRLIHLSIRRRESYEDHPNAFCGDATFSDHTGKVQINLDERASEEILRICASSIVRASQALANELTANILALPAIKDRSDDSTA